MGQFDGGVGGVRVLDDVGEQFGDGEVEGCLDGLFRATFKGAANVDLDRGVKGQRPDGVDQAPLDQDRGVDASDQCP